MNYYISDLHLFHEAAIKYDNRPFSTLEEMHRAIMKNWNDTVTNGDTVYILGDISMRGTNEELIAFVAKLKGQKVLIKGNHDQVSDFRYKQLFSGIYDYKEIKDTAHKETYHLVLSHYPIFSWNRMNRGAVLLYGHVHNGAEDAYFQKCIEGMKNECRHANGQDVKAYNVGCMKSVINYKPRTLEEILCFDEIEKQTDERT
ncbi:MAG: phosphoesterase [Lachnospiraceae bacterium]|nr:phosphoesterase [Lachnospiraceae bacterium]